MDGVIGLIAAVALLLSAFYACQTPVCVVVLARFSAGQAGASRFGIGFGAVSPSGARRRALRGLSAPREGRFNWRGWLEKRGWMDEALRGAIYLYEHRLTLRASVDATLGGMDAAQLALCWGAAQGLFGALSACTQGRFTGALRADFSAASSRVELRVTYAVRAGTALAAAARAVGEYALERVRTWKGIPLRAS